MIYMSPPLDARAKDRLFDTIRKNKKINLEESAKILNIPPGDLGTLLFDMVEAKKIGGDLQRDDFIIASDVDSAIYLVRQAVEEWIANEAIKTENIDPEQQKQAEEKIVKEKRSEIKWTKIIGIVDLILFVIFLVFVFQAI